MCTWDFVSTRFHFVGLHRVYTHARAREAVEPSRALRVPTSLASGCIIEYIYIYIYTRCLLLRKSARPGVCGVCGDGPAAIFRGYHAKKYIRHASSASPAGNILSLSLPLLSTDKRDETSTGAENVKHRIAPSYDSRLRLENEEDYFSQESANPSWRLEYWMISNRRSRRDGVTVPIFRNSLESPSGTNPLCQPTFACYTRK